MASLDEAGFNRRKLPPLLHPHPHTRRGKERWRKKQKGSGWFVGMLVSFLSLLSGCVLIEVVVNLLAPLPVSAQPAGENVQEQAEEASRAMDVFLREQKVLIRRNEIGLELSTFYGEDTQEQFVQTDSGTAVAKTTYRSANTILIARYGLIDNLELDLEIPFVAAEREVDIGVARRRTDDQGVGDIAGRARYQLLHEEEGTPDLILEVDAKSRSGDSPLLGTGHWRVGGGVTLVKTLDPVVAFGRLGYSAALKREGVDPGDQISYLLGMGYSLNDRVSLNMQVGGAVVRRTELNGKGIRGSSLDIINLQFGVTTLITRNLFIEPFVNFGLTDEAADVIVGINLIYQ